MALRQLVTCVTISVLVSSVANSSISDLTGAAYQEAVRIEAQQKLFLGKVYSLEDLASGVYSQYQVPNRLHTPGMMHSAIYHYNRDGRARLVKTILPGSQAYISDEYFQKEIFGMLLSSHIGGPEVFRAGRFRAVDNQIGYFVEMEEIFPGASDTYTYKGFGSKTPLSRLLSFRFPSDLQLRKVARLIRLNLERNITIGVDPDFIFSGDDVRWIDTAEWSISKEDISMENFDSQLALHNYGYLLTQVFRLKPRAGRLLARALREEISSSEIWNPSQKSGILSNLKKVLVNNWHWSDADYFDEPPSRESLFSRCVRLLSGS